MKKYLSLILALGICMSMCVFPAAAISANEAENAYSYGTASEYINRYIVNFSNMLKPPVDNESVELFNGRDA